MFYFIHLTTTKLIYIKCHPCKRYYIIDLYNAERTRTLFNYFLFVKKKKILHRHSFYDNTLLEYIFYI